MPPQSLQSQLPLNHPYTSVAALVASQDTPLRKWANQAAADTEELVTRVPAGPKRFTGKALLSCAWNLIQL